MVDQIVFTATEARQNFFELLRMAEEGKEPIVTRKNNSVRFKMTVIKEKKKEKNINKILKEMGEIHMPILSIKKINKILSTRHEIKI
ncbi:hypothetical protein CO165_01230 [Candidatus Roizmanbacteria bacterium CG_4_9_14_3_um_filter_33_18]|uniref:Antitoxin n=3 Tax=Candidatus Roizmaniibacteriota TaxID=1752723 RepID=A0A2M7U7U0_9BACT|nr:MAG: hypothetical protein COW97_01815 [Candidatus Roizmanbacteria bacterium CG22_combo_CG10-13_8_21_14_all_34_12]PIZ67310.1 MAG: hypothetical protein COY12_02175 [Candidatus Roizmanbacteria bacterium CG_4_10_14_0_2_um_filter_33_96]PJA55883.1 MAG: hypothetical protein CO165_01230 [Candidatus Roizmanbacteria bacterium CG_4_9_14_3_um_filter_33_18]